jgi:beta-mannosidase
MDLSGRWRALEADDELRRTWLDDDVDESSWEPIEVPGHWRSTPAFAEASGPLLYRTHFSPERPADGERVWLVFDGCFYQGDVWLDGGYVGDTEGYFFPHGFEITEALAQRDDHVLGVELTCSAPSDRTAKRNLTGVFQHSEDMGPDWNPGGIWRPVRLERSGPVRVRHLRVLCREATPEQAIVSVRAVLDATDAGPVTVRTTVGETDHEAGHTLAAGENQITWTVTISDPDLWWPRALGDQPLHQVTVEVLVPAQSELGVAGPVITGQDTPSSQDVAEERGQDTDRAGPLVVSDRRERRIGLRRIELRNWIASVNGERLFLKGSNLGPSRMELADATPDELRRDVAFAVEAGLDLLRVRGHITRPELYDAADEAGLLLWQDMPLQWGYSRLVRKQAVRQAREAVDLLGHHPSVAIWCGHNEPLALDVDPGSADPPDQAPWTMVGQQLPTWNKTVLDRSIKRALQRHDGSRPVVAHSGVVPHPPKLDGTDSHLFFGWRHGDERRLPGFARLVPRMVRFVSEFGAQAVPETDDFVDSGRWPDLDWERLAHEHSLQRDLFDRHVPPDQFESYDAWRNATQAYQAALVKRHIEELRRLKYHPTGGFAQFCMADSRPVVGYSLLDHERAPKAGWEALKAACQPVIVVADRLPASVVVGDQLSIDVHVISDLRVPIEGAVLRARAAWEGGEREWRFGGDVPEDSCVLIATLRLDVPGAAGLLTLDLCLSADDGTERARNSDETLVIS